MGGFIVWLRGAGGPVLVGYDSIENFANYAP